MVKALRDAELSSVSCFAHTLQLALHYAILTQPSVADLVRVSRKIVGHFRHSLSASSRLHAIQEKLGIPKQKLHRDVATRWYSTYQLLDQKRAVCVYVAECEDKSS
jgi:hypothetical protein